MRFRNIETGRVIDVSCEINGKKWVKVDGDQAVSVTDTSSEAEAPKKKPVKRKKKTE